MTMTEITGCEDALRHLAAHLDGELDDPTRGGMDRHLSKCRSCYSRAEFERRLKEQLAALRREEVGPELESRVRTLLSQFTVAGRG